MWGGKRRPSKCPSREEYVIPTTEYSAVIKKNKSRARSFNS